MADVAGKEPVEVPIFAEFESWQGLAPANFDVNFLGQRTDVSFVSGWADKERLIDREAWPPYPTVSEETFEWVAVLRAVLEARGTFSMIELGAGYGRWLVAAACAVRRRRAELGLRLMAVEAEPTHFKWLLKHFADNQIDAENHLLIEAAVGAHDGVAFLTIASDPAATYGQRLLGSPADARNFGYADAVAVRTHSLATLLDHFSFVDLIDIDIQGAELDVIAAAPNELTRKVKRIHIGTHSPEIESGLRTLFGRAGWRSESDYSCLGKRETVYGEIEFQDGAQTWVNPNFLVQANR
jgi:FkbM family methyltransferase